MKPILVVGGGGHAKVVISILKRLPDYKILGYVDTEDKGLLLGIPYLGQDSVLPDLKKLHLDCGAVIGLGYVGVVNKREELSENLLSLGYSLPAIISPKAIINEEVIVGDGTVVVDGSIVNSGTTIGRCVIINTNSSVDHDCVIGDFTHIAPGATLSGGVQVGAHSFLGAGTIVIQYKTIGAHCVVGAGGVVVEDCKIAGTYVGVPVKKIQIRISNHKIKF